MNFHATAQWQQVSDLIAQANEEPGVLSDWIPGLVLVAAIFVAWLWFRRRRQAPR